MHTKFNGILYMGHMAISNRYIAFLHCINTKIPSLNPAGAPFSNAP